MKMKELKENVTAVADGDVTEVKVADVKEADKKANKKEKVDAYVEESLAAPKKPRKTAAKKATKEERVETEKVEVAAPIMEETPTEASEEKPVKKPRKKAAPKATMAEAPVEKVVPTKVIQWTNTWSHESGYVESINYEHGHFVNTTGKEYAQKFATVEAAQAAIQALIAMGEGNTNLFDVVE